MVQPSPDDSSNNGRGVRQARSRKVRSAMPLKKDSRKRRSDRLMVRIPLHISGLTETGEAFDCRGHAVAVNRYGAHIRLERAVPAARKILLTNLENNLRGEFRIVKVLESSPAGQTAFGIEALGNYPTFWGIAFPSRPKKAGESRGLLECQQCHSASLHALMLDEIEVLEFGGAVRKPCPSCGARTEWKFSLDCARAALPEAEPEAPGGAHAAAEKQPPRRTVLMQRPVSIWTAAGDVELVQTENLSKDEIRCSSEKSYEVNQVVTLEWENSGTGKRLQVQGRIRRRQSIAGSRRVVYSIRYEGAPAVLPPVPLRPAGKLYALVGILSAGASVLVALSVHRIIFSLTIPFGSEARPLALLGAALLLAALAHKSWKTILAREPENRQALRKRHLTAAWITTIIFLGSLGAGMMTGVASGRQRGLRLKFLHDFALARIFESNIDAAENRVMNSPEDYSDVCATLALLAAKWRARQEALAADTLGLSHFQLWQGAESREEVTGLEGLLALDRRKLRVVDDQIALKAEAKDVSSEKQMAFWQASFPPLRQKILELNSRKEQEVRALASEK